MRVLVTGAAGYLGSVLVPLLLDRGLEVRALDAFYFPIDPFGGIKDHPNLEIIKADTRLFDPVHLKGADAVIDLAAVAQTDPENSLPATLFYDMNCLGPLRVAGLSKVAGVKRFIYASSTSVYGVREDIADENATVGPVEIYASTKYEAEQNILKLNGDGFSVTALRFATLYGPSPKMRFDLLVNRMALSACADNTIFIGGGGRQQRVALHVNDAARAVMGCLETGASSTGGEVINIGSNDQNFSIIEIGQRIAPLFPGVKFVCYGEPDKRSFRVNFDKAGRILNFAPRFNLEDAVMEIRAVLHRGLVPREEHYVIPWWGKLAAGGKIR